MDSLNDPLYLEDFGVSCDTGSATQATRMNMTLQPLGSMVSDQGHHERGVGGSVGSVSLHQGQLGLPAAASQSASALAASTSSVRSHSASGPAHTGSGAGGTPGHLTPVSAAGHRSTSSSHAAQHTVTAHNVTPIKIEPSQNTSRTSLGEYSSFFKHYFVEKVTMSCQAQRLKRNIIGFEGKNTK